LSNVSTDPIIIHTFNPLTRATWLSNPPTTSFKAKPGHLFWEHLVLRLLLPCIKAPAEILCTLGSCTSYMGVANWTSTHQHIIHWMPVITRLWMNLNWVSIWFHFGNPLCTK
jgi:hypothetical protein